MTERGRRNTHATIGILVTTRRGIGAHNAHRWWVHMRLGWLPTVSWSPADIEIAAPAVADTPIRMTLANALQLQRAAGYGDPPRGGSAGRPGCCVHAGGVGISVLVVLILLWSFTAVSLFQVIAFAAEASW